MSKDKWICALHWYLWEKKFLEMEQNYCQLPPSDFLFEYDTVSEVSLWMKVKSRQTKQIPQILYVIVWFRSEVAELTLGRSLWRSYESRSLQGDFKLPNLALWDILKIKDKCVAPWSLYRLIIKWIRKLLIIRKYSFRKPKLSLCSL